MAKSGQYLSHQRQPVHLSDPSGRLPPRSVLFCPYLRFLPPFVSQMWTQIPHPLQVASSTFTLNFLANGVTPV